MNNEVSKFLEKLKEIIDRNRKFLYYTRGVKFQKDSAIELETFMKKLVKLKEKMIRIKDEESANILLSLENLLTTYINEFKMLIFLKENEMHKAWESLIKAQNSLRNAFQANDIVLNLNAKNYLQKLGVIEKLFFPPQTFVSIGATVENSKCSICNEEYGKCNHVKGKPYMGKLCCRIITKIKDTKEVSLVDSPGNKLCRVTSLLEKEGWRDLLTWRIAQKKTTSRKKIHTRQGMHTI
jgi:flagellar biosynthesis/type III secretory pathway chaperone